jgi:STE24 endopeptidase
MNLFTYFILFTILLSFCIDLVSQILNLKHLTLELPKEFINDISKEDYEKSQKYTKTKTKFSIISSSFDLILFIIFWFLGGFNFLDIYLRMNFSNEIYLGVSYIGILLIAKTILDLPFSIYSTFVIEEKFGFNKTTVKTFIIDIFKSTFLSVLIGIPLLGLILYFFQYFGNNAWLYVWISTLAFSLILTYIAPTWIMPLFNKFKPMEDGDLKNLIFEFAEKVNYPLKKIFIMDGSKRSTKSNAYFTGFGNNKRIVLFDTLVENHSNNEILTILAHEIGHFKKKHILKNMIISSIQSGFIFFLLGIFMYNSKLHEAFYMQNIYVYTSLIFFGMIYSPIGEIISIAFNILSRKYEFQADEFAVSTTKLYNDFINALKKLSVKNLSNLTPHPLYVFLNYSHPTVLERIRNINELERKNEFKK